MGVFNIADGSIQPHYMVFPSAASVLQFGSHQILVEHPLIHQIQLHLLIFIRFLRIVPRSTFEGSRCTKALTMPGVRGRAEPQGLEAQTYDSSYRGYSRM